MKAVGIDIGTTTISAVVMDADSGALVTACTIDNGSFLESEYPWEKIQDAGAILTRATGLLEELRERYDDIGVIGLTGQMHGILYTNAQGKHISPLYIWQDGRGDAESFEGKSICQLLRETCGIKSYTGYGLVTHLYNCRAGLVPTGAAKVCTIMDYFGMALTGRREPLTHSSNAASMGLYDAQKNCFLKEVLEQFSCDTSILPEITDRFEVLGTWNGIPVCTAIGDNQASFLGSVEDAEHAILVNMGTGGQISVLSDQYFTAQGVEARPFAQGFYLLAGSSLCGGRAYAMLESFFRSYAQAMQAPKTDHYAVMNRLLESYDAKDRPLQVTTTFAGTREEPKKRGSIREIGTENFTPAALTYGVLDGMAQELYEMYARIAEGLQIRKDRMVASGNGIRKNRFLQDIMCRKFSMTLQMAVNQEEAACGAVKSGLIASGRMTLEEAVGKSD